MKSDQDIPNLLLIWMFRVLAASIAFAIVLIVVGAL